MTTYTRSISRVTLSQIPLPAWRRNMTVPDRLYRVAGAPSTANASIVWPGGSVPDLYTLSYPGAGDQGRETMMGWSSGTVLEDVGAFGTMAFGTGGHNVIWNQMLGLRLSDDVPSWYWYQQPKYQTTAAGAAATGADLYWSPSEYAALQATAPSRVLENGTWSKNWAEGKVGYRQWIYPGPYARFNQLGNNTPHGLRYLRMGYVPPSMTGNGAGGLIRFSAAMQGPAHQGDLPDEIGQSLTYAEWYGPTGTWPSGRRKQPIYIQNVQTGAWEQLNGLFEPDFVQRDLVSGFNTVVIPAMKRVYTFCQQAGGDPGFFYVSMPSGLASATVSGYIATTGALQGRDQYFKGVAVSNSAGNFVVFLHEGSTNRLIVFNADTGASYLTNVIANISWTLEQGGTICGGYDAANNRLIFVRNWDTDAGGTVPEPVTYFTVPVPANPMNVAGYVATEHHLTIDSSVTDTLDYVQVSSGKSQYIPSLDACLVCLGQGHVMAFAPSPP